MVVEKLCNRIPSQYVKTFRFKSKHSRINVWKQSNTNNNIVSEDAEDVTAAGNNGALSVRKDVRERTEVAYRDDPASKNSTAQ